MSEARSFNHILSLSLYLFLFLFFFISFFFSMLCSMCHLLPFLHAAHSAMLVMRTATHENALQQGFVGARIRDVLDAMSFACSAF